MEKKLKRLTTFLSQSFKKVIENPLDFFNGQQDLSKYVLRYKSVYDVKEVGSLFREHLETEFNTAPFDFIMEYIALEEDYEDLENIKLLKHFLDVYFDENSENELNLNAKVKKQVLDTIETKKQLKEIQKWILGETLKKLFLPSQRAVSHDLAADSFARFTKSELWHSNAKKFIKNPEVMEKLEVFDVKESKDKKWTRESYKEGEEKERKEELAKKFLAQGLELFKEKKWQESFEAFTNAIESDENLKEAYFNRGVLNYNCQKYVDAIADMVVVIDKDPKNAKALSVRGMSLKKLGKYDLAVEDLKNSLIYEEIVNNYMLMGICYDILEMENEAIEAYSNFISKSKIKQDDPAMELFKENMMSVFRNRAQAYFSISKHNEAIQDYTKAISMCGNEDIVREMKGKRSLCFKALGFEEEAKRDYIDSMQNNVNEIYNEGINLFYKKKYIEALDTMNAAIEIKDDDFNFYFVRGVCYKYIGELEHAIQDFETSFKLNPEYTKAVFPLLKLYEKLNKMKSVLRCYDILLEKCPTAELYLDRATLYGEIEGKENESLSDFSSAIQLNPDLIDAYYNRGQIYKQSEEYEKAIQDFDKCLSIENPDADLFVDRGWCFYSLDKLEEATKDFKKAIELDPENERAQNLLSQLEDGDEEE
jgi:tetratricopeptide (TPR) repeat protein